MYLSIIIIPFLGSCLAGGFGRYLGPYGTSLITIFSMASAATLSCFVFYEVGLSSCPCYIKGIFWISSEYFYTNWGFLFDSLTALMLVIVTIISMLVHIYSTEYMSHDPCLPRFMSYLSLFTAFMVVLVTADNYIQMFFGWEGIGLTSFLLINFWFTRLQANKAAIKAMLLNRLGDFGLAIGIFLIYLHFQSLDYDSVFALSSLLESRKVFFFLFDVNLLGLVGILLFVGAIGKSAQIGLHTWLPDAMEGPTPVSALIHAATLVTAGVFLLVRSSPILENSQQVLSVITVFGALTAFFSASTGLFQNDLKRVIAYSTCSQLGYMVFACGASNYATGIFHLANHAFFKALLFLSAGAVIHGVKDEQDMRKMGGLAKTVPFTYGMILIGSFSLMGLPFLTGYYSKDFILETSYAKHGILAHFSFWLGCAAAFFTAFYSTRLIFLTFLSEPNGFRPILSKTHESPTKMTLPLGVLAVPSIFIGYFTQDMITGMGTTFWGNSIQTFPENFSNTDAEFIPLGIKLLPVFFSLLGGAFAFSVYTYKQRLLYSLKLNLLGRKLYTFLNRKWFFDKIYNEILLQNVLIFGYSVSFKILDRGMVEFLGPRGLTLLIHLHASAMQKLQTGYVYQYAFLIFAGTALTITATTMKFYSLLVVDYKFTAVILVGLAAFNLQRIIKK